MDLFYYLTGARFSYIEMFLPTYICYCPRNLRVPRNCFKTVKEADNVFYNNGDRRV